MGRIRTAAPVKLFSGLLGSDPDLLKRTRQLLVREFGPVDLESERWPFDQTDYYAPEMGPGLLRWFVSFETLITPDRLADVKRETNALEEQVAQDTAALADVPRPVNIDPGYINLSKLVLASTKESAHRVYLGQGIYAEVTLQYAHGGWQPFPWTYPDFRDNRYHPFFQRVRDRYREQQAAAAHHEPGADVP